MLRSLLKTGLAWGLDRARIGRRRSPFIVGYHRTVDRFPTDAKAGIPSLCVSVKMLERQLDWIGQRFRFVSLDESCQAASDPVASVTFDDGYQDFYRYAFPLLKRKGIPATAFVVTDLVGTSELQIHDRLYLLLARSLSSREAQAKLESILATRPQSEVLRWIEDMESRVEIDRDVQREHLSLNWEEIAEIRDAGFTIGSHTQTHAVLTSEGANKVNAELRGSRETLERRLGETVRHFAYPCGQFSVKTIDAVEEAGYEFAYTICEHRASHAPALTISRKLLWENSCLSAFGSFSSSIMSGHANGSFDRFAGCKLNHGGILCWS